MMAYVQWECYKADGRNLERNRLTRQLAARIAFVLVAPRDELI